jgi:hypothetical protein
MRAACSRLHGGRRYKDEQPLNVIDDAYRTWYEVFVPSFHDSNGDGNGSGDTDRNVTFVDWLVDYCWTIDPDVYIVGEVWSNASTIAEYRLSSMARSLECTGSRIILVINTSEEAKVIEFARTTDQYTGIRGYLSTTGAAVTLRGDRLVLPPMAIVVLK